MKTVVTLIRKMEEFDILQRSSDGYFDSNVLLRQWNSQEGCVRRRMDKFLESENTKTFIRALAEDESQRSKMTIAENQLVISQKGKNTKHGKTVDKVWMHPVLFIKFAM